MTNGLIYFLNIILSIELSVCRQGSCDLVNWVINTSKNYKSSTYIFCTYSTIHKMLKCVLLSSVKVNGKKSCLLYIWRCKKEFVFIVSDSDSILARPG